MAGERVSVDQWPSQLGSIEDWGLVEGPHGVELPNVFELLEGATIRHALGRRAAGWVRGLEIHTTLGSTSDRLLALAERGPVDGVVCLAELQTKGRGRRGRTWLTPLGGSLALSAGFDIRRRLAELGGLSLVVGLALLDCLRELGCGSLALKWPNDLLLGGAKVGGILIELSATPTQQSVTQAVVGVGINLNLSSRVREAIDQEVTDLAAAGNSVGRNELAARVIGNLVDYIGEFERVGFGPMREQYNVHHWMHNKDCEVRIGTDLVPGRVLGVTDSGELELQTDSGPRKFRGGEVSLRERKRTRG